jgi:hypothetical protein
MDLIKREDAIKVVDSYIGTDPIVEKLKSNPSAEPKWIPCSERLPEEDICNSYLIAWIPANEKVKCGLPHYYQVADWEDGDWTNLDFCGHEEIVILAWMPLPEPWEGADDERL